MSVSSPAEGPGDVAAAFCATFFDELARAGVRQVVVAPGSRSTPLALAAAGDERLHVEVHHDERCAAYMALGVGIGTGVPAVVVTTSGTAAALVHSAVVEAHQAHVPLIVLTADRPPGFVDWGAPQTIDQKRLYGAAVRWFGDPGLANRGGAGGWRPLAAKAHALATGSPPGPVHLNLAFDESLIGTARDLPAGRSGNRPWFSAPRPLTAADDITNDAVAAVAAGQRGVLVAGGNIADPDGVHLLAATLGWPVIADPRSRCRVPATATIAHADALLRHEGFAERARPEVVIRLGSLPASKVLGAWLDGLDAWQVAIETHAKTYDPGRSLNSLVAGEPGATCRAMAELVAEQVRAEPSWLDLWAQSDAVAAQALDRALAGQASLSEPEVARTVAAHSPADAAVMVASSMPVRDMEWYAAPRNGPAVLANRGANGIDGVVSTAMGVSLGAGVPVVALLGDVAMLHDSNALAGCAHRRGLSLTVVVVDNDGGGIFSFLAQATALDRAVFEKLFGTPHGTDLSAIARAHGAEVLQVTDRRELAELLAEAEQVSGVRVLRVVTDRQANVAIHEELNRAVAEALDRSLG